MSENEIDSRGSNKVPTLYPFHRTHVCDERGAKEVKDTIINCIEPVLFES